MSDDPRKLSKADLEVRLKALRSRGTVSKEVVDLMMEIEFRDAYSGPRGWHFFDEITSYSDRLGYEKGRVFSALMIVMDDYFDARHAQALAGLTRIRPRLEHIDDDRLKTMVIGAMAEVHKSLGNYESSLECALDGLQLALKGGQDVEVAWFYYGLAAGSNDLGDPTRALEYVQKGRKKFEELRREMHEVRLDVGIARCMVETGHALFILGQLDEAKKELEEALPLFRKADNRMGVARVFTDLGRIAAEEDKLEEAEALHRRALEIRREDQARQSQATSLLHLGDLRRAKGDLLSAIKLLEEALQIAVDTGVRVRQYQIHEALSLAFEQLGDFESALKHHREFHRIEEQVSNDSLNGRIADLQMRFEIENAEKEAEIERLRNVELKQTLDDLKSAQDRLVHAEKMASLGSMTAGIAHEIKNPLNFVNNFSALSEDIVEELAGALTTGDQKQSKAPGKLVSELLTDLRENARRIREHGQRADSIVKNMLMHAGGQTSFRKTTDINVLLKEYAGLAFHGMRASNPDFNVSIVQDLSPAPLKADIAPQEIGRVFLNLLSNAFDATHARKLGNDEPGYQPAVTIATRRVDDMVEAMISDNGQGIPEEHRSRIFEPFFTTKPTGKGTGLGLSLSYDIVVHGHNGELVLDDGSEGTTFSVRLPAAQSSESEENGMSSTG